MNWVTLYALLSKKIAESEGIHNEVVEELPSTGQENILYFVPKDEPGTSDIYDEYIWSNGEYEKIGSTEIDLSGYLTSDDVASVAISGDYDDLENKPDLSGYLTSNDVANVAISGAYSDLTGAPTLASVATSGDYNDLENKPTVPDPVSISETLTPDIYKKKIAKLTIGSSDTEVYSDDAEKVIKKIFGEDTILEGNPISFDAFTGIETAKTAEVSFLPKQDLHGYDSPWVGGAGVNKWDEQWESGSYRSSDGTPSVDNSRIRSKNRIEVLSDSMYLVTLASTIIFLYDATDTYLGYKSVNGSGLITPITWYANAKYIRFAVGSSSNPVTTYTSGIAINYPSTVTIYTPYENICPITGWMELNLKRTGKNLMSPLVKGVGLVASTGAEQVSATSATTDYIPVKFTNDVPYYYLSGLSNQISSFINAYNKDKQSLGRTSGATRAEIRLDNTFPNAGGTPQGTGEIAYIRITQYVIAGQTATIDIVDTLTPQLEIGQTASQYEAYQGQIYTEPLGDTYYGGKVTWHADGSCTADIDRLITALNGTESWTKYQSTNRYYADGLSFQGLLDTDNMDSISNEFSFGGYITSMAGASTEGKYYLQNNVGRVAINSDIFSTASELETYLSINNMQIVFPLATPISLTLTPQEIALLKGANVISTDGNNIKLAFSADIKAAIDKAIQESITDVLEEEY